MTSSLAMLCWRSLAARPLRSLLTTLAITLGVGMVLAAAMVGQAAAQGAARLSEQSQMGNVVLVQSVLGLVGLMILLAAAFVIWNAFAMAVTARTREVAALRALGMTRRQVRRLVLAEAGLLGLVGVGLGLLAGLTLAGGVVRAMGTLEDVRLAVPGWGLVLSVSLGLGVTLLGALQPARRAGRISPIAALRIRASSPGRYERYGGRLGGLLLCLLLCGLLLVGLLLRPDAITAQAFFLLGQAGVLGAMVLLLPALVRPTAALARPLLRRLGAPGRLALDNILRNRLRTAMTVGALAAGLTMLVALNGLSTAAFKGSILRLGSMLQEDAFVVVDLAYLVETKQLAMENFLQAITQPLLDMAPVIEALEPLERSGRIRIERCCFAPVPPELGAIPGAPGIFVDPEIFLRIGNFDFFQGDPDSALDAFQGGPAVLLPPLAAQRLGVQVGDPLLLPTPQGEMRFTVAGVGGSAYALPVLSFADGRRYFGLTTPTHLGIVVLEGNVQATLDEIASIVAPFNLTLYSAENTFAPLVGIVDRLQALLSALLLLAVLVAALGVANTMVINLAERRRELGLLRAVGATRGQVRQTVVIEAALVGLMGALLAAVLGLLMLASWGMLVLPHGTASIGVRLDLETIRLTIGAGLRDWALAAMGALVLGPLVAGAAVCLPARGAGRQRVLGALAEE
ncbi:MAG: FtsX-like permease family protein [Chloroflexia bacterium]|nr:FtsX-like permease family protein [Chloroflexia bacterium]